ncbi:MAG: hypothetical protein J4G04_01965 [Nitrosopumilaceae archaeon]|nr:hypothetical protein [Nitrosopumilaceae archaeon]
MGYDYDGLIEGLRKFKAEKEEDAENAAADGRHDIASMLRESARGYDATIAKCEAIRDRQSP